MDTNRTVNVSDLGNGDSYEGAIFGKQKHGYGVYRYSSGDVYAGDWEHDEQNGHGVYQFANGSVYEGEFKEGQFNGSGKLKYQAKEHDDMVECFGNWENSLPHGKCFVRYLNADEYEGDFIRGVRSGIGIYLFNQFFRYEGEWRDNCFHGFGKLFRHG